MTDLRDPEVQALLSAPNFGVLSTHNSDGSILSTVVWVGYDDGELSLNSSLGRRWPTNLERDPRATLVVYDLQNPYSYVEVRGVARGGPDDAYRGIHRLSNKYLGSDYPNLTPGEQRLRFTIDPERVRFAG
jgi:PPOX class probable F420-dependent enzyme